MLTTEKDWVRIDGRVEVDEDIALLKIKMRLVSGSDAFFKIITEGIGRSGLNKNASKIQT